MSAFSKCARAKPLRYDIAKLTFWSSWPNDRGQLLKLNWSWTRNVQSFVGSVPSNGSGSRTLAQEPSPWVLTFLANAEMVVARLFPAFSLSESVRLSKGSSPKPSSPGSSGLLSLLGVDSVQWDLGNLAKSSSGWCSGNGIKRGERCRLEATGVLVPLRVLWSANFADNYE